MSETVKRMRKCRVCGHDNWIDIVSFGAHPLANAFFDPSETDAVQASYPIDVIVCQECWLMAIRDVIDPETLYRYYVYATSDSEQISRHMNEIVRQCAELSALAPGDLVVELGSNVGTQLRLFQEAGYRVVGVDPATNLAAVANKAGVTTLPTFFGADSATAVLAEHGQARQVLGRQCFAHIDDVHDVLDGVTKLLATDGVLTIEVPYLVDLLRDNQFDTIYHEHLSYYSVHTLRYLFRTHGLRVIDVRRAAVHGGSIVISAAHDDSAHRTRDSVEELLSLERREGITSERSYREFAARAEHTIGAVGELVRSLVAEGHRVAGYGAPSKGCALLQFCGLSDRELVFCVDSTPLKQGKLLPESRVPVVTRAQARADEPDYYLLLAWNYAEEIIGKEREFTDRGGKFIVPIPEPKIVSAQRISG